MDMLKFNEVFLCGTQGSSPNSSARFSDDFTGNRS